MKNFDIFLSKLTNKRKYYHILNKYWRIFSPYALRIVTILRLSLKFFGSRNIDKHILLMYNFLKNKGVV